MTRSAPVALVSFVLGACGAEEWSFDAVGTDAGTRPDASMDAPMDASTDVSTGGCSSDADCLLKTLHCDTETGQCVACVKNYQCPSNELCAPTMRCVQCSADDECPLGEKCQPNTYKCVPSCTDSADCPMSAQYCSTRGLCVGCLRDSQCEYGACDPDIGQCAECTSPLQCMSGTCDRTTDRCVGCLNSFDCGQGEACDPNHLVCVGPMDASSKDGPAEVSVH